MALRGIKPTKVEKRLKALFYGKAGVGKTTAALQFPRAYLIDTEKGAIQEQYVEMLEKNGGAYFECVDFDDLIKEVKSLLVEKHPYKTLVIDPLTTLYNDLLDKCANSVGTEFGRHYGESKKHMKQLLNLLLRLDMNVIITSHSKNEYGDGMVILGQTFDCYKQLDYIFDLVFEIQKKGKKRLGIIKKSRIVAFPDCDSFEFSYDEIAKRYGKEVLEKDAVPEQMASEEQIARLEYLIDTFKESPETVQKWLAKAQASDFTELKEDVIAKIIKHLEGKFEGKEK